LEVPVVPVNIVVLCFGMKSVFGVIGTHQTQNIIYVVKMAASFFHHTSLPHNPS
jgi:hypothetical protein